jgi:hypothetical protein
MKIILSGAIVKLLRKIQARKAMEKNILKVERKYVIIDFD